MATPTSLVAIFVGPIMTTPLFVPIVWPGPPPKLDVFPALVWDAPMCAFKPVSTMDASGNILKVWPAALVQMLVVLEWVLLPVQRLLALSSAPLVPPGATAALSRFELAAKKLVGCLRTLLESVITARVTGTMALVGGT